MTKALNNLMNEKRAPDKEIERFNRAQECLDFETMFDVLYHTSCQYLKKRVGWMCSSSCSSSSSSSSKSQWSSEKMSDVAIDMTTEILLRYKKNPSYRCLHMAAVHFAFLKVVYGKMQKEEKQDKNLCCFDDVNLYDYTVDRYSQYDY